MSENFIEEPAKQGPIYCFHYSGKVSSYLLPIFVEVDRLKYREDI